MSNPIDASPNPASQLERAIIHYLEQCLTGAWDLNSGTFTLQSLEAIQAGKAADYNFYFSNDWKRREAPLYEVLAHSSKENLTHSRNEDCEVTITAEWPGNNVIGQENPDVNWQSINQQIGYVMAALSVDDGSKNFKLTTAAITASGRNLAVIDPKNQADMANFTCTYLEYRGALRAKVVSGEMFIMEKRNFMIRAMPSNVD